MLVMQQGKSKKRSVGGEEPQGGMAGPPRRFGLSSKYVIARRSNGALEPLRTTLPSGVEALPVFAAEQAAWRYLRSETLGAGWYVRESGGGELASMLMSLCSGVESILLDPDSSTVTAGITVERKCFLKACLDPGAHRSGEAGHLLGGAEHAAGGCRG